MPASRNSTCVWQDLIILVGGLPVHLSAVNITASNGFVFQAKTFQNFICINIIFKFVGINNNCGCGMNAFKPGFRTDALQMVVVRLARICTTNITSIFFLQSFCLQRVCARFHLNYNQKFPLYNIPVASRDNM